MVQTRAAAKRIESGQEAYSSSFVPSPTKKRRIDGTDPPRKRHRGKQRELCQLNLDVLFLLAAYVHPLDLLNLARTCRSLRELLMDKASTFVWKTARCQVNELPGCPADLTEPEYANLVFYARCHGCGKYAKKMLWAIRRRYCPDCRKERLCRLSSCPDVVREENILPKQQLTVNGEKSYWVDKEQLNSVVREYEHSADKDQFLKEKREQYYMIYMHARRCQEWELDLALKRKYDLDFRRQERSRSIFERLEQHGYEPEITYFGSYNIEQSCKSFFKTSKPLTDKEWALMLPKWLENMESFRAQRRDVAVYRPRRNLLVSEYANYVASPSTPASGLLPHVTHLARFQPVHDTIYAPEETLGSHPFEPAFAQLPAYADEWRKSLEIELANLVHIPSHLSPQIGSSGQALSRCSETTTEPLELAANKLRLACAVFDTGQYNRVACTYPGVFSTAIRLRTMHNAKDDSQCTFEERFGIRFVENVAYIVHACGLDPNVATVEDMDRRNARLICLDCRLRYIRSWRNAVYHSYRHPQPAWERISDEHIDAIQALELTNKNNPSPQYLRCLLCQPSVGDAKSPYEISEHFFNDHGITRDAIRPGEDHVNVCMDQSVPVVQMVETEGQVSFKQIMDLGAI